MRGLKQKILNAYISDESHLLQMRGLKLKRKSVQSIVSSSHLLQMRGLKRSNKYKDYRKMGRIFYRCVDWNLWYVTLKCYICVASFTDAWIETEVAVWWTERKRRIFYRCVDWNRCGDVEQLPVRCRIFYRCVDWNLDEMTPYEVQERRIFYRCVDWNFWFRICGTPW